MAEQVNEWFLGEVELGGHNWEVHGFRGTEQFYEGPACLGYCHYDRQRIGLCLFHSKGFPVPSSSVDSTFLHEVLHALMFYARITPEDEEEAVKRLELITFPFLMANAPGFFHELYARWDWPDEYVLALESE